MIVTLITGEAAVAAQASDCGVDRVMVDLEILGKVARQGHRNTLISNHTIEDVRAVRRAYSGECVVRINAMHSDSREEIESCVRAGADFLMLPMFRSVREVELFLEMVNGRAQTLLLFETAAAITRVYPILNLGGVDEAHIGLNDLHLDMGLDFMFEPLYGGILDGVADVFRRQSIPFGIGGVGSLGGHHDVPAELILNEHVRLGSQSALISRELSSPIHRAVASGDSLADFKNEIVRIREFFAHASCEPMERIMERHMAFVSAVSLVVAKRHALNLAWQSKEASE